MKARYTILEIADALGRSQRGALKRADREQWPYESVPGRGGRRGLRREYPLDTLPAEIQAALIRKYAPAAAAEELPRINADAPAAPAKPAHTYDHASLWSWYDRLPQGMKDEAARKLCACHQVAALLAQSPDAKRGRIYDAVAQAEGVPVGTLKRWWLRVAPHPRSDWLALLADHYTGRTKLADCSPEAWDYWKADYLRLERPAAAACYKRLQRVAAERGWTVPSIRTLERRTEREISAPVRILLRQGQEALMRRYPPLERDETELHALEWINGDGYQHNVFVKFPDGQVGRPKTWVWQDVYSRKILAWRTDETENTDVLRLSLAELLHRYGIPEHVTIDNTRAAANKWLTGGVRNRYRFTVKDDEPWGIFTTLGVQIHWTSVFNGHGLGQAKPVERAFGIGGVSEIVDKHPAFAGAYTGHNPTAKPENYGSKAIKWDTFTAVLAQEIRAWNASEKRRTRAAGGVLSFDQVFSRSFEASPIRRATEEQLRLCLLAAESVLVKADSTFSLEAGGIVGVGRNRYHAGALYEHAGQRIVVRFDPQDLHDRVYAYSLDGRYIGDCRCIESAGFGDTETGRDHNRERKRFIKHTKLAAAAEQRMSAIEAAGQLPQAPESPTPTAKIIRPHRMATPVQRELTRQEREALAQAEADLAPERQSAEVVEMETPAARYRRWLALDARIAAGKPVSPRDQGWHRSYPESAEWRAQRDFYEDFGLEAGQ